jgi:tripartite-type tricarboxylate transporter receptor subunit TctC
MNKKTLAYLFVSLSGLLFSLTVFSQLQQWPIKPIKIIVPYAPGLSPDIVARVLADKLSQSVGQPVLIDNRPGAGGLIGAEAAATASPDGYTYFFTVKAVMAIAPHLYPNAKFNTFKDFKAVTQVLLVPHILTATPNAPFNNIKELVDYAKRNPGKLNYASLGVGSQPHVAVEIMANKLGLKINHIPYKTNPIADVISGIVDLNLEGASSAIPNIKAGKIKALAISGNDRISVLPDLPTITESDNSLDQNGIIGSSWHGIFAPTGTSDAIIQKLNSELIRIIKTPDVQERLIALGLTPTGTTSNLLSNTVTLDYAYWGKLIKDLNIKLD